MVTTSIASYHASRSQLRFDSPFVVRIDQLVGKRCWHYAVIKNKKEQSLTVRCPTCGALPGQKCELSTGLPRTEPHRDRRLAAMDK